MYIAVFVILLTVFVFIRKEVKEPLSLAPDGNETYGGNSANYVRASEPSTPNFKLKDFHSKDGQKVPREYYGNVQRMMEILEIIRAYLGGKPIYINSGWRSHQHNDNEGGATNSMHLVAKAVDFWSKHYTPVQIQQAIKTLRATGQIPKGGIGYYNTFTHIDIGRPRQWWG